MSLGIAAGNWPAAAAAQAVDTELVLLVDVSSSGLKKNEFEQVMAGYAGAMTSAQVLDAIQSGALGRIAVSMIFYGDDTLQEVGIPWMMIGGAAEAQLFADAALAAQRPGSGSSSMSSALDMATAAFGTETGAADNGYTSAAQIIEVAGATEPRGGNPDDLTAQLQASRDDALAAGVDVIHSLALGKKASQLEAYYAANVIGGTAGGIAADSSSNPVDGGLGGILASHLNDGIQGGANASIDAIPEPRIAQVMLLSMSVLLLRSRFRR